MCSAYCFMKLYIGVMFHENISNSIKVMEQRQIYEALMDGWMDGQTDTQNFGSYNVIPLHNL